MNKAISTALLLAAGTALANAATLITSDETFSPLTDLTFSGQKVEGEEKVLVDSEHYTVNSSATGFSASIASASATTSGVTVTSNVGAMYWSDKEASHSVVGVNVNVGNSGNSWTIGITLTNSSNSAVSFNGLSLSMIGFTSGGNIQNPDGGVAASSSSISNLITNNDDRTQKPVNISVAYTAQDSDVATDLIRGFAFDMGNTAADSPTTGTFSFDSVTIGAGESITLLVTAENNSAYIDGTFAAISGISLGNVAIPEPSAFGLLAGLGALALVAARRRRSRKA